jgi:hypothetical protein
MHITPKVVRRGLDCLVAAGVLTLLVVNGTTSRAGARVGDTSHPRLLGYGSSQLPSDSAFDAIPAVTNAPATFTIDGGVSGLYPGQSLPLFLIVTNPFRFSITVTSIDTTVGSGTLRCSASYLTVTKFSGRLSVAAGGTARAAVIATMLRIAPNACQGVTFDLHYQGTATKP